MFARPTGGQISPPKIQFRPISTKIGVHVRTDPRDVMTVFVSRKKLFSPGLQGVKYHPPKIFYSDLPENLCARAKLPAGN